MGKAVALAETTILQRTFSLAQRQVLALAARDLAEFDQLAMDRQLLGVPFRGAGPADSANTSHLLDALRVCDSHIERGLAELAVEYSRELAARRRAQLSASTYQFLFLDAPHGPSRG